MKPKTVLITGASRGIGRETAFLFAAQGYDVIINASKSEEALHKVKYTIEQNGGSCAMHLCDVGNPQAVRHMFEQISVSRGGVDILVNNAGISHIGLLSDMTDEEWHSLIQTNLSSVFYCSRAAIPYMVSQKSGCIVNVSSMWGTAGASCEAAYSASKAGIHGLTKALAKELAPSNIPVNAVAFGVIDTDMNRQLSFEERAELEASIPAGYFASPKEAAEMIVRTAECPAYMTGQIIGFDGGFL